MNAEGHELLWELHSEEWLGYKGECCDAVLADHGMGLFELYAANPGAAKAAVDAGLDFAEWVEATHPATAPPKRL